MEIEEALIAYLNQQTGLMDLIGRRIYWDEAEDKTYPHVVGIDISDVKTHTLSGQITLESPVKQFTIHAADRQSAKAVAKQLKAALSDFRGTMSGLEVQYIQLLNELPFSYHNDEGTLIEFTLNLEYQIHFVNE